MADRSGKLDDSIKKVFRDYAEALLAAILIALVLRFFVVTAYKIPTSSMSPNLKVGDFIFVNRLSYGVNLPLFSETPFIGFEMPQRGDVVVFKCPQDESMNCVKRLVALPGDKVEIRRKNLFINGVKAEYERGDQNLVENLPGADYRVVVVEKTDEHTRNILISSRDESEDFGPIIVQPGHFFVLGDSRDTSDDSRYWGSIPLKALQGRVMLIWFSLDWSPTWSNEGWPEVRWKRLFQKVY